MKVVKSNTELLILLQRDDKVAFYHIYERYSKRLYGFAYRFVKQESDAEELVQEVFLRIWETRHKIDAYSSFESLLFAIAYNATMSLFRKRLSEKKYVEHIQSLQQFKKAPDLIEEVQFNELNEKVQSLINKLTPRQQEIYQLSRESGLSHQEIAQKLNISPGTVKKHISNILSYLKANLDSSLMINLLFLSLFL
ncbi:MAG: RNA polymerase sigma-70 factor [Bacteroidales bacterium]|nr:RNA polymerase sigma-70 factor [Bacteroidales bacterium]